MQVNSFHLSQIERASSLWQKKKKKKDGGLRPCIDYHTIYINDILIYSRNPADHRCHSSFRVETLAGGSQTSVWPLLVTQYVSGHTQMCKDFSSAPLPRHHGTYLRVKFSHCPFLDRSHLSHLGENWTEDPRDWSLPEVILHKHSWSHYIPWTEYAQNSLCQATTGLKPFQCVFSFQLPLFPWSGEPLKVSDVNHWFQESKNVWGAVYVLCVFTGDYSLYITPQVSFSKKNIFQLTYM